jgi:hypothetical protein
MLPLADEEDDFSCPITHEVMDFPVTLETGITYEKAAVQKWLETRNSCPVTRKVLQSRVLPNVNVILRNRVRAWREGRSLFIGLMARLDSRVYNQELVCPLRR